MGNKFSVKRGPESAFTKPTGLYPNCEWDDKTVKKLINKKKIAPRYPGREEQAPDLDECPICFLWYPGGLNRSKCCRQSICTECFLQFKKPTPARPIQCPFCNAQNYTVKFSGVKTKEEREAIAQEEQRVIEAKIRMRKEELAQQQEKEAELAAEREKRLREGPPPAASPPPTAQIRDSSGAARDSGGAARQEHARPSSLHQHHEQRSGAPAAEPRTPPRLPVLSAPVADMPPNARQSPSDQEEEQHSEAEFHSEIEDLMVMEAIRLSLLDSASQQGGGENDGAEAGAGRRGDERGILGTNGGDLEDSDAEAGQAMDDEDWPAVTWGDQGHEAILRQQGGAAGPRESAFEEQVRRVAAEMEHDACLFELLVFSNNFFTPDTSFPPPVPASDDVAFNNHPIAPAVLEADLCVTTPEDDVSRFGQDGDDEECYEESHNGIALEFEGKEALGSFSSGGEMEVSAPSTSADAEDADLNGKPIVDGAGIPSGVEILETVDEENHEHMHVSTPDDEEASGAPAQDPGAGASENEDSFFRQSGDPIVQDGGTSVGQVAPALDDEGGADAGARLDITSPSTSARAPSVPASPFIDFVREHRALQEGGVPQMGSESSGSCGPDSHSSPVSASGMDVSPRRGGELHLIGGDAIPEQEETPSQTWCIEPDLCLEDRVGSSSQDVSVEVAVDGGAGATDSSAVESKTGEATSATAQPESEPGVQCGVMEEDQPE